MQLPSWLAGITGAQKFANNPANSFVPSWGDAMQGIGHSMMEHYRRPSGTQTPGVPGGGPQGMQAPQARGRPQQALSQMSPQSNLSVGQAPDMRAVLQALLARNSSIQ